MMNKVSLFAFLTLAGASMAPALADDATSQPMLPNPSAAKVEAAAAQTGDQTAQAVQAEDAAARAATQAAQAAQVAAQAAQAAAQAAQAAAKEAETLKAGGTSPQTQVQAGQAAPAQPDQPLKPSQSMTREYRLISPAEMKARENAPPPSPNQNVVNGASVGDFLGSGVQLDRRQMDNVMDREYNSLVRLDPLKPGEAAPSVNPDVANYRLAEAKKNQPQRNGFQKFLHGCVNGVEDVGAMVGFPIGPDDDDARMDKFDDM